jgi:signal peptidase
VAVRRRCRVVGRIAATAYLAALGWLIGCVALAVALPGITPVAISSGSMAPAIHEGDVVVSADVGRDDVLLRGDVIVFRTAAGLMTHRVEAALRDGAYRTKGDANAVADAEPVERADVVGRARLLIPSVGRVLLWRERGEVEPLTGWLLVTTSAVAVLLRRSHSAAPTSTAAVHEPAGGASQPS